MNIPSGNLLQYRYRYGTFQENEIQIFHPKATERFATIRDLRTTVPVPYQYHCPSQYRSSYNHRWASLTRNLTS
jgi:hypothetical protein